MRSAVPPPETNKPCWWGDHARALTAAVCLRRLAVGVVEWRLQILSRLSLPPEASCCWSNDHFRPHTSCLCPVSFVIHSALDRISLAMIDLSLDPLATRLFVFQAIAPTRPVWPLYVNVFLFFMQSQSWTSPEWVPTPNTFDDGVELTLVIKSFSLNSTNRTTLEFPAFQIYTLLLSPTASRLEADQSTKFK